MQIYFLVFLLFAVFRLNWEDEMTKTKSSAPLFLFSQYLMEGSDLKTVIKEYLNGLLL